MDRVLPDWRKHETELELGSQVYVAFPIGNGRKEHCSPS